MELTKGVATIGRVWGWLGFAALVGAWITQLTGRPLLGMSQQHLFSDATVMVLLCIANLLDAQAHAKRM